MSSDLSSFYLDLSKDILYCDKKDSLRRKQVQTVIDRCLHTLMLLWTPILSFTMEEVYSFYPFKKEKFAQLEDYPVVSNEFEKEYLDEYALFLSLRGDVLKGLETSRASGLIGSAQEAHVYVSLKDERLVSLLTKISKEELAKLFVVSEIDVVDENDGFDLEVSNVKVTKHLGHRCDRCWNYVGELHEVGEHHVCSRCLEAIGDYHEED